MKPHHAILALAIAVAACSEPPPPPVVPPVVKVLTAGQTPAGGHNAYSGEVRARRETTLGFRVGGKIVERLVDAGSVVVPGQVLARMDPADMALQSHQAEAQRVLAEADLGRYRDLRSRNFVAQAALDAKETAFQAAAAQAALARNQQAYAVLRADKAGVIAQVLAEPGQVVAAGQGIFRLAEAGALEVAISVPESRIADLRPGAPAEVTLWASGKRFAGRVREVSPAADAATRTYPVRVAVSGDTAGLALGMTAGVEFGTAGAAGLQLPLAAIFQQGQGHAVWIVDADDTLALRPVVVASYGDDGAVVASGVVPGDRVVAAGVHKLTAGQKVRPQP